MNILIIHGEKHPPFRADTQVLFGDMLAGRGHHVRLMLQSEEYLSSPREIHWHGMSLFIGENTGTPSLAGRIRRHLQRLRHDLRLFGELRNGDYDCILVTDRFLGGLLAIAGALLHSTPFVFWLSFSVPEAQLFRSKESPQPWRLLLAARGKFNNLILTRVVPRFARHIFVQSEAMKTQLHAKGIPGEKMTAVPMGVCKAELDQALAQDVEPTPGRLIYVGVMDRQRRLDFLLRVFALVRERVRNAELYMVGWTYEGAGLAYLKQEAVRLGIKESVFFTGFVPRIEAFRLVRSSAACFSPMFPSPMLETTSPTKCMEYLALGRPVVGNAEIPDMRHVLERSGGGLCVPWQEEAFARAAVRLLENPELAADMGRKGRDWMLRHREYTIIADMVERRLRDVLQPH